MSKLYPRLPNLLQPRTLKLSDFPEQRTEGWTSEALEYWEQHHITPPLQRDTVYPTYRGICFVLYGGLGYQERVFDGDLRWLYPVNVDVSGMLYVPTIGDEEENEELFVVEGTTDAMAINQSGHRSAAILGTMLTSARAKLLKELIYDPKQVYYIPDNDEPGLAMVDRLVCFGLPVKIRYLPTGIKDICELYRQARQMFLRSIACNDM